MYIDVCEALPCAYMRTDMHADLHLCCTVITLSSSPVLISIGKSRHIRSKYYYKKPIGVLDPPHAAGMWRSILSPAGRRIIQSWCWSMLLLISLLLPYPIGHILTFLLSWNYCYCTIVAITAYLLSFLGCYHNIFVIVTYLSSQHSSYLIEGRFKVALQACHLIPFQLSRCPM